MLKPALVVMTLMGCDCDARICVPLGEAGPGWASIEECEAAVVPAIRQGAGRDYPLVRAHCEAVAEVSPGPMPAAETAGGAQEAIVPAIARAGQTGRLIVARTVEGYVVLRDGAGRAMAGALGYATAAASWARSWTPLAP